MKIVTERWNDVKGMTETLVLNLPDNTTQAQVDSLVGRFLIDPNVSKVECGERVWYGSFVNPIEVL